MFDNCRCQKSEFKGQSTGHFFSVAQNYYDLFYNKIKTLIAGGPVYRTRFNKDQLLQLPNDIMLMCESTWKSKWKYLLNARLLLVKQREI